MAAAHVKRGASKVYSEQVDDSTFLINTSCGQHHFGKELYVASRANELGQPHWSGPALWVGDQIVAIIQPALGYCE
jgi:hypothetical protein